MIDFKRQGILGSSEEQVFTLCELVTKSIVTNTLTEALLTLRELVTKSIVTKLNTLTEALFSLMSLLRKVSSLTRSQGVLGHPEVQSEPVWDEKWRSSRTRPSILF